MLTLIKSTFYKLAKQHLWIKKSVVFIYAKMIWALSKYKILFGNYYLSAPVENIEYSTELWIKKANASNNFKASYIKLSDSEEKQAILPKVKTPWTWKYKANQTIKYSPTWVATIENARVVEQGFVITPDNQLLGDVSPTMKKAGPTKTDMNHAVIKNQLPPLKLVKGRAAVLSFPYAGSNYFHWLIDLLPRIYLIEKAGIDLDAIDYFIVNDYLSQNHIMSLSVLGISKNKILTNRWNPHIQVQELIVPSLVCTYNGEGRRLFAQWLQQKFCAKLTSNKEQKSRIYINRKKASYRRVIKENEIESLLLQRGFESVSLEDFSIFEQAQLLNNAKVVIAPHGAGLSNIVFCQPETVVIELLHHKAVNLMYWYMCNDLELDYNYLLSKGEALEEGQDCYDNFVDMSFDLPSISGLLDELKII